ncbi:MAG: hypothetical protein ACKODU_04165 [Limnohabitans sp.]|jgi:hypothetical protein
MSSQHLSEPLIDDRTLEDKCLRLIFRHTGKIYLLLLSASVVAVAIENQWL